MSKKKKKKQTFRVVTTSHFGVFGLSIYPMSEEQRAYIFLNHIHKYNKKVEVFNDAAGNKLIRCKNQPPERYGVKFVPHDESMDIGEAIKIYYKDLHNFIYKI
jgi:hypothetical protein